MSKEVWVRAEAEGANMDGEYVIRLGGVCLTVPGRDVISLTIDSYLAGGHRRECATRQETPGRCNCGALER